MLDHVGLNVPDLVEARRYYDELMPLLGFEPFVASDRQFSYRPAGGKPGTAIFFYTADDARDYARAATGLQHLAFRARTRDEVDVAHAKAMELGGQTIRPPGIYDQYHEHYYAAYWLDLHGFLLEAVCHKPQPGAAGGT